MIDEHMHFRQVAGRWHLTLSPRQMDFVQDPYRIYAQMRAVAPIFFWEDYGFWCLPRFADVSAVLRDRRFGRDVSHLRSRAELGWPEPPAHLAPFTAFESLSMLEREPPAHTRLRNLVTRAFVSRRIQQLAPQISRLAHDLVDDFASRKDVDILSKFATPIPVAVICDLIGVPRSMATQLLEWSHSMVAMYQFRRDRAVEDAAVAATIAFTTYIKELVAERRAAPRDDLMSHLVAARDGEDALSEDELVVNCILLLNAGHEASVHAIANAIKLILEFGLNSRKYLINEAAVESLVEETLRYEPPLHMFTRYALEDMELHGVTLRLGDKVGLLLGSANRDETRFSDAHRFDPSRPSQGHVTFGAGLHFCIGAPLARLEMQIALPVLFERLPGLTIAEPPRWRDSYHFRGLEGLRLTW